MKKISLGLAIVMTTLLGPWISIANTESLRSAPADVAVTSDRLTASNKMYYFTMTLPEHTESFLRLSFTEMSQEQALNPIQFDLVNAKAFTETPDAMGRPIASDAWMDETGTFWIEFTPAVSPGTQLTVALKGKNSSSGQSHQYGIAAYTDTETPTAIFVGNGTLRN